jgi:hypothetical protein
MTVSCGRILRSCHVAMAAAMWPRPWLLSPKWRMLAIRRYWP